MKPMYHILDMKIIANRMFKKQTEFEIYELQMNWMKVIGVKKRIVKV
jgi:hypothetical protein